MAYYLDLFNGDPRAGGVSILEAVTGSSARVDVTEALADYSYPTLRLTNPDYIVISEASLNGVNISYVGLFADATGGDPVRVRRVGSHYTIAEGNLVQFVPLALTFIAPVIGLRCVFSSTGTLAGTLTIASDLLLWGGDVLMWGDLELAWG